MLFLLSLSSWVAHAQTTTPERPGLPAWSLAGDGGAFSLWRNPANLGQRNAGDLGVLYGQGLPGSTETGQFALATKGGPLGLGVSQRGGADAPSWWTVSSGVAVRLDRRLILGTHVGWQLPEGLNNNFTTLDLGMSWRPASWLGLAGVVQNIGAPGQALGVSEQYGAGVTLRPAGERLRLGVDYLVTGVPNDIDAGVLQGNLQWRVTEGLLVRAYGDDTGRVGGGLELGFGGVGVGGHAQAATDGSGQGAWMNYIQNTEDQLFANRNRVPKITIDGGYAYQPTTSLLGAPVRNETYLHLLQRIDAVADDRSAKGLVLHLENSAFSFAQLEELRDAMGRARAEGKTIAVYLNKASSNGAYFLASAADSIYLHPAGGLDLIGLSVEQRYLRGLLEIVGVEPQVVRRADYKTAFEQFTEYDASEPGAEAINALLDDTFDAMVDAIAAGRGLSPEKVRSLIDQGPFTAQLAEQEGLIDGVAYPRDLKKELEEQFGQGFAIDEQEDLFATERAWRSAREIAVVFIDGPIVTGPSSPGGLFNGRSAGSETIVKQLEAAANQASVKAVVLRVDSPGGSAFASDEIWRAIKRVKSKKPVVVSMGGLAASGGYWVSANATAIYANPSTITGSIGVITAKFSLAGLYEKVGVNTTTFNRGLNANLYSSSRPWTPGQLAAIERSIDTTYEEFLNKVADGRGMTRDDVHKVAQGRVWSGIDAHQHGLVDELGGFRDALLRAKQEAGIAPGARVDLVTYTTRVGGGTATSTKVGVRHGAFAWLPFQPTPPSLPLPPELAWLHTYESLQGERAWALLPYDLEIE